jgi:hypothetical protein
MPAPLPLLAGRPQIITTIAHRVWGGLVKAVRVLAGMVRGLFGMTSATAEMLSDAGHGPEPWREDGEFENPYAGAGPEPDDTLDR